MKGMFFIVMLVISPCLLAQDCYQAFLERGIEAYGQYKFQQSIDLFNAAKICPDNDADKILEIDQWITRANNGYINEITKARDEALLLQKEALRQARLSEANRLAYLANQELDKSNSNDALLLAYSALDMIAEEPLDQVVQIFGNVVATTHSSTYQAEQLILDCNFMGDDHIWITCGDNSLVIWKPGVRADTITIRCEHEITCSEADSDRRAIILGFANGDWEIWDISGKLLNRKQGTGDPITDISFTKHEGHFVTAYRSTGIKIWSKTGELVAESGQQGVPVKEVAFSENGSQIITRTAASEIQVFNLLGVKTSTITHRKYIYGVRLSPGEGQILTYSADSTARLSKISGELIQEFPHPAKVHKARFSPDGQKVLTAALDQHIRLWDIKGHLLWSVKNNDSTIESIQFSPDGTSCLSFSDSRAVDIWSIDGSLITRLDLHTGPVLSATFSPDSKYVLTNSTDQTAKVWSIDGKLLMNSIQNSGPVHLGKFADDGYNILTASELGSLVILQNPVHVFEQLKASPPSFTEEQKDRYGINPTQ